MTTLQRALLTSTAVLSLALPALSQAGERRFTYVYQTDVQPVGAREIEVWNTYRSGKSDYFRRIDNRIEFEFGVANNLASSLYLNNTASTAQVGEELVSSHSMSISTEWKYKLLDAVADPIGLGLYGELTLGTEETELEGKLLVDKHFGSFVAAFNAVYEQEWEAEFENGEVEAEGEEAKLEFNLGLAYYIAHDFTVGLEARMQNVIEHGETEHSALFVGPAISYSTEHWWATLTLMPQVAGIKEKTDGSLDLEEFEKVQSRLIFAFSL